ncbi:MAG: hypothetical protein IJT73_07140 [Selenomonadaceae bacterium]|nr:hypothetical protein [Selenomonadaceae bacterium]
MDKKYILTDLLNARIILDVIRGVAEDLRHENISADLGKVDAAISEAYQFIQDNTEDLK